MSIHTLKSPTYMYIDRAQYKTRSGPTLALKPCSVLVQTDESENLPGFKKKSLSDSRSIQTNSPLLSHANTIGIIGGVSAVSTVTFLQKLVKWSLKDGEQNLPFVVCNDPMLIRTEVLGSRYYFPCNKTKNIRSQFDHNEVLENLRSKKDFLEKAGARCIVMPCNVSHMWHGEISQSCSVPFLHVGECVAKELKEANFKPVEAGSSLRIGVISTDAFLSSDVYHKKLQDQGFEVVLPDRATIEHTIIPAVDALKKNDIEGARNLLRIALQVLLVRAVNTIILASDDMRDLLPRNDPLRNKCIDPMDALVRSTVKWAQSNEKAHNIC